MRKDLRQKEQTWVKVNSWEEVVPGDFTLRFRLWSREWPGVLVTGDGETWSHSDRAGPSVSHH